MAVVDFDKFGAVMDKKVEKKEDNREITRADVYQSEVKTRTEEGGENDTRPCRDKKYNRRSVNKDDIRPYYKKLYDVGKMPLRHKELYIEILKNLRGTMEGVVQTDAIARGLQMSGTGKRSALNALEAYGYFESWPEGGLRKLGTHVKMLKDPKDVLPEWNFDVFKTASER
jgi:hypothetical protein